MASNDIQAMCEAIGMVHDGDDGIALYHVIAAALAHCDAVRPRLDFDATLAAVRDDIAADQPVPAQRPKREPQVSMMMGGFGR